MESCDPEGLHCRSVSTDIDFLVRKASPTDASAIAHVYVASWRSTYGGLLPPAVLRGMSEVRETLFWWTALCAQRPRSVTLVMQDRQGKAIGFIAAGPERAVAGGQRAEVYTLYLLEEFQRRGLGTRLLAGAADALQAGGFGSLVVWVLAGNPARAFYEHLGAERVAARTIRMGGQSVHELAFAWPDLAFACAATAKRS